MQTVGIMQVIPLMGDADLYDQDIIGPEDEDYKTEFGTSDYGEMSFDNPTNKVLLVPCHVGYVVSQAAQDHAMSHAGLVDKNKSKTYKDAMCIQQSQGGHISKGQHQMTILPYALREAATRVSSKRSYSKLWDNIAEFNRSMGVGSGDGHLEYFLKHFSKELDLFLAEFECINGQCGAIILMNGQVVGVERAPSPKFWMQVWRPLIRDCYGSLAIEIGNKTSAGSVPKTRVPLRGNIRSLDDLGDALIARCRKQKQEVGKVINKLLDDPFSVATEESLRRYQISTVENDQFCGQIVSDDSKVSYASLFTTKKWAKSAPWRQANKFSI